MNPFKSAEDMNLSSKQQIVSFDNVGSGMISMIRTTAWYNFAWYNFACAFTQSVGCSEMNKGQFRSEAVSRNPNHHS